MKKALELVVGPSDEIAQSANEPKVQHSKPRAHKPRQIDIAKASRQLFSRPLKQLSERQLIQLESEIGSQLFGEWPETVIRREFFNLDPSTWVWHEESYDEQKQIHTSTIRYEVQPQGILKAQGGARYSYLEGQELDNFLVAVQLYYERISREIYKRHPETGSPLL
ncbi:hypothetical protein FJZ39_00190 [Candidatus Saccharibacteria bacterium]|nr:hypothetical protein [Candidatus Saccharibacteria bacterium]